MAAQGTAFIHATSLFPRNMSLAHLDAHEALINRKDFLNSLGIDVSSLVCCRQVHSPRLQCVGPADAGRGAFCVASAFPGTDALITGTQRLPLAVFTADCLPVFFFDPRSPAAGIAHAGWRGVHRGIIQAVVQGMRRHFKSAAQDISVIIGPGIQQCCYEVGKEFQGLFPGKVLERGNKLYLDLAAAVVARLAEAGVKRSNIQNPGECSCCSEAKYFSFRRQAGAAGRMMSVIMLQRSP